MGRTTQKLWRTYWLPLWESTGYSGMEKNWWPGKQVKRTEERCWMNDDCNNIILDTIICITKFSNSWMYLRYTIVIYSFYSPDLMKYDVILKTLPKTENVVIPIKKLASPLNFEYFLFISLVIVFYFITSRCRRKIPTYMRLNCT